MSPPPFSTTTVSVVMSVHNGARFLEQAVHSIRTQTFSDFEYLIVDDGSTDASPEILARHAASDRRIRILTQENKGLIESLNRAFAEAAGTCIARMDADDVARPNRLELQMAFLSANPGIALVGGAIEIIDSDGQPVSVTRLPTEPEQIRMHMRKHGNALAHPTVLFRREALCRTGGFRKAYRHAEDYDLWLRMLETCDFANLPDVLLGYRRHEASISRLHAVQQILSAMGARVTARRRLEGFPDITDGRDLVTRAVLGELGVPQEAIDAEIFAGLQAMVEDSIRCGMPAAAADFSILAGPYASPERVKQVALELNRRAAAAVASKNEGDVFRHRSSSQAGDPRSAAAPAASIAPAERNRRLSAPSLKQLLEQNRYETDKSEKSLRNYERAFAHLRTVPIALMEIGINRGGSLLLWRDYFTRSRIVGLDLNPPEDFSDSSGRIRMFQCDQSDRERLDALATQASTSGYHIIIDDASHIGALTAASFETLFYKHLRPGGFYAIEDWGTGYWESWPDGSKPEFLVAPRVERHGNQFASHQSGMVGFIKQLVDECGLMDIQHPRLGVAGSHRSYIRSVHISPGLVIIEKTV
jgi:hypothetical protein